MGSMLEALKKAKLVDTDKVTEKKDPTLTFQTAEGYTFKNSVAIDTIGLSRRFADEEQIARQQRFLNRASRETTKPGHNAGTKAFLNRFTDSYGRPVPQK